MKERKAFLLRIDPDLHAALEAWAAQELRSLNGQIEYLLKEAVARRAAKRDDGPKPARRPPPPPDNPREHIQEKRRGLP